MNYKVNIDFTEFLDAREVEVADGDGQLESGIFIPFNKNDLRMSKHGHVYCQLAAFEKRNNYYYGQTHSIVPMWSARHRDKMHMLGIEPQYVGNITPMKGSCRQYGKDNDSTNAVIIDENE